MQTRRTILAAGLCAAFAAGFAGALTEAAGAEAPAG